MGVLSAFFAWPGGGVWSNLVASAITGAATAAVTIWRVRKHLHRHHAEWYAHLDDRLAGLLPGGVDPHLGDGDG